MSHWRRVTLDGSPAIVCIVRRAALCDPVSRHGTARRNPQPGSTPRGVGRWPRLSKTGFSARTPLEFLPASPLSRRPICRWGIPAVATSWELEWNGPPVAGCQSRPSWCRGKRRIRLPTPRPVKASDPVGSAVRRGGGRVPRAWGFAPDLTVTSQTSGSAHGGRPQSQRGARVCSQHQLT